MVLKAELEKIASEAKTASYKLACLETDIKNICLREMADELNRHKQFILKANERDIKLCFRRKSSSAFIDRLRLTEGRINAMSESLLEISNLPDPVGQIDNIIKRPNGLLIGKMKVPIGVVCVIYESRPNVTADCIGLCLKSGNSLILRGGSEAINSNIAIYNVLKNVLTKSGIEKGAFNIVKHTGRRAVDILLSMTGIIDLVIPRGGQSLIEAVTRKSKIPVIKHYKGVCHVYIDSKADLKMAQEISFNAKVQRPGVCNAMETLLVHKDIARRFLRPMADKFKKAKVELRGCYLTRKILKGFSIKSAKEADWHEEYLDLILSIRTVNTMDEAISHINKYGTGHSDAIVTQDYVNAMKFLNTVDSAVVYVNASTRFTDGFEFGKGAEIGISTDKLHARGPMGLEELTTYKYVIFGNGQIRK